MRNREHIEHWAILLIGVVLCAGMTIAVIIKAGEHNKAKREAWDALWTTIGEEDTP
jgi:hypothetical protein